MNRIEQGKELLKLIEEVNVNDFRTLDFIDVKFDCLLENNEIEVVDGEMTIDGNFVFQEDFPQYTRSRDALKAIRPEGWAFTVSMNENGDSLAQAFKGCNRNAPADVELRSPLENRLTEELAELHAIIQALIWEAENE
jgi:hypothetical protein